MKMASTLPTRATSTRSTPSACPTPPRIWTASCSSSTCSSPTSTAWAVVLALRQRYLRALFGQELPVAAEPSQHQPVRLRSALDVSWPIAKPSTPPGRPNTNTSHWTTRLVDLKVKYSHSNTDQTDERSATAFSADLRRAQDGHRLQRQDLEVRNISLFDTGPLEHAVTNGVQIRKHRREIEMWMPGRPTTCPSTTTAITSRASCPMARSTPTPSTCRTPSPSATSP